MQTDMSTSKGPSTRRRRSRIATFFVNVVTQGAGLPWAVLRMHVLRDYLGIVCLFVLGFGSLVFAASSAWPRGSAALYLGTVVYGGFAALGLRRSCIEVQLKREVASMGNAACLECGRRLIERNGQCPACGWEYEDVGEVTKFWAEWEPCAGLLYRISGGRRADCMQPGRVKPALLTRLRMRFEVLFIVCGVMIGGVVLVYGRCLQGAASLSALLWPYLVAVFALVVVLSLGCRFAERRLKRDVVGKDNAACFECGYWLTEPTGRCPECGWAYESLEDVVRFWSEWQPFRRFPRLRKQKAVEAEGSGDPGSSKEVSAPE